MPPKPLNLQSLARVMAADPQLRSWEARRRHDEALTRAVRRGLPRPLGEQVVATSAAEGHLDLSTPSGAIAAVLRQRLGAVRAALSREGLEFTAIKVRVQPRVGPVPSEKKLPRQWDSNARGALTALEANLPDGPLKTAVGRWLRRAG